MFFLRAPFGESLLLEVQRFLVPWGWSHSVTGSVRLSSLGDGLRLGQKAGSDARIPKTQKREHGHTAHVNTQHTPHTTQHNTQYTAHSTQHTRKSSAGISPGWTWAWLLIWIAIVFRVPWSRNAERTRLLFSCITLSVLLSTLSCEHALSSTLSSKWPRYR